MSSEGSRGSVPASSSRHTCNHLFTVRLVVTVRLRPLAFRIGRVLLPITMAVPATIGAEPFPSAATPHSSQASASLVTSHPARGIADAGSRESLLRLRAPVKRRAVAPGDIPQERRPSRVTRLLLPPRVIQRSSFSSRHAGDLSAATSASTRLSPSSARRKIVRGWPCEVDAPPARGRDGERSLR
jgi:hypothetical protein